MAPDDQMTGRVSKLEEDVSTLKVETVGLTMPAQRQAGVIVGSVDELIDKLANEAKVI